MLSELTCRTALLQKCSDL